MFLNVVSKQSITMEVRNLLEYLNEYGWVNVISRGILVISSIGLLYYNWLVVGGLALAAAVSLIVSDLYFPEDYKDIAESVLFLIVIIAFTVKWSLVGSLFLAGASFIAVIGALLAFSSNFSDFLSSDE